MPIIQIIAATGGALVAGGTIFMGYCLLAISKRAEEMAHWAKGDE